MNYRIGIEDLAANALIAVLKSKKSRRFLSYAEIEKYGAHVVQLLNQESKKATLILSRENTSAMFRNYPEFFEEREQNGQFGIYLREDKQPKDLILKFRGYLALDVLLAFVDKRAIEVLSVIA